MKRFLKYNRYELSDHEREKIWYGIRRDLASDARTHGFFPTAWRSALAGFATMAALAILGAWWIGSNQPDQLQTADPGLIARAPATGSFESEPTGSRTLDKSEIKTFSPGNEPRADQWSADTNRKAGRIALSKPKDGLPPGPGLAVSSRRISDVISGDATNDGLATLDGKQNALKQLQQADADLFVATAYSSLSTFPLAVGASSWATARDQLDHGRLPLPGTIRVEEFVNAYDPGWRQNTDDMIRIHSDGAASPFDDGYTLLRVGLTGPLRTIAREATIQVEFDPRVVKQWRLLGFENNDAPDREPHSRASDADGVYALNQVTALYELKLAQPVAGTNGSTTTAAAGPVPAIHVGTVRLRYTAPTEDATATDQVRQSEQTILLSQLTGDFASGSVWMRIQAVAAEFAEILRGDLSVGGKRLTALIPVADGLTAELPDEPMVRGLADMIHQATDLQEKQE